MHIAHGPVRPGKTISQGMRLARSMYYLSRVGRPCPPRDYLYDYIYYYHARENPGLPESSSCTVSPVPYTYLSRPPVKLDVSVEAYDTT